MTENMALMGDIARNIATCGELDGIDWVEVSAIFAFDDDGDVNSSYGYAYDAQGEAHAAAFLYDDVEQAVKAYRDWLKQDDDQGMIKMIFQFNRQSKKVNADFEYSDANRWQVTPKNVDTIALQLKPNLG